MSVCRKTTEPSGLRISLEGETERDALVGRVTFDRELTPYTHMTPKRTRSGSQTCLSPRVLWRLETTNPVTGNPVGTGASGG